MTNQDILKIALKQSAIDSGCQPEDFLSGKNKIVISKPSCDARRYLKLPFFCDLTSYGSCIVASVAEEFAEEAAAYLASYPVEHCFETPNMQVLEKALRRYDMCICFMAEYFLPDMTCLQPLSSPFPLRVLYPDDFSDLYLPEWSNALCRERRHLDRIAIGAYDGDKLIGMAGASADCDTMWQIGIDVLPAYRRRNVASALTSQLAMKILDHGIVPFYCCAWSNIPSARNAIRSGFRPAWVSLTAKSIAAVNEINGR